MGCSPGSASSAEGSTGLAIAEETFGFLDDGSLSVADPDLAGFSAASVQAEAGSVPVGEFGFLADDNVGVDVLAATDPSAGFDFVADGAAVLEHGLTSESIRAGEGEVAVTNPDSWIASAAVATGDAFEPVPSGLPHDSSSNGACCGGCAGGGECRGAGHGANESRNPVLFGRVERRPEPFVGMGVNNASQRIGATSSDDGSSITTTAVLADVAIFTEIPNPVADPVLGKCCCCPEGITLEQKPRTSRKPPGPVICELDVKVLYKITGSGELADEDRCKWKWDEGSWTPEIPGNYDKGTWKKGEWNSGMENTPTGRDLTKGFNKKQKDICEYGGEGWDGYPDTMQAAGLLRTFYQFISICGGKTCACKPECCCAYVRVMIGRLFGVPVCFMSAYGTCGSSGDECKQPSLGEMAVLFLRGDFDPRVAPPTYLEYDTEVTVEGE